MVFMGPGSCVILRLDVQDTRVPETYHAGLQPERFQAYKFFQKRENIIIGERVIMTKRKGSEMSYMRQERSQVTSSDITTVVLKQGSVIML